MLKIKDDVKLEEFGYCYINLGDDFYYEKIIEPTKQDIDNFNIKFKSKAKRSYEVKIIIGNDMCIYINFKVEYFSSNKIIIREIEEDREFYYIKDLIKANLVEKVEE